MLDFSTITITNLGYQELTNNSLESLKKITNEIKPTIYCMDENSLENFKNLKYNTSLLEYKLSTSCEYMKPNWATVTMQKLVAIHTELLLNKPYVFMFDGDIVFKDINAITELCEIMNENTELDLICQNEYQGSKSELNTGYLFVRNNEKTKQFFNPSNYINKYPNDQYFVNHEKRLLNIHVLSNDKFPNGKYFYENHQLIKPYMIHFNFVKGHDKKGKMKNFGCWLLE
jgi:hypothetical protein